MTRKEQEALVKLVMHQVGNIVEFGMYSDDEILANVSPTEIAEQLGVWMAKLPSKHWDNMLPYPKK